MSHALRKPMTLAEFLAWEERQPLRYEFDGIGPVAMTGGTAGHADIQANLAAALRTRLRGNSCATVYARLGETWTHEILIADSILCLPEIGVELPLAELYEGIVFEPAQNVDPAPGGEPA